VIFINGKLIERLGEHAAAAPGSCS